MQSNLPSRPCGALLAAIERGVAGSIALAILLSGYWGWCRASDPWAIRVSVVSEGNLRAALR
ncbi:MAG: hypothetical protein ACRD3M_00165, partial [Thermoanaerobaculia bacterium]